MKRRRGKRIQYYLMPVGALVQAFVPRWLALRIACLFIRLAFPFLKSQRRVIAENYRYISGMRNAECGMRNADAYALRVLCNLAATSADLLRAPLLTRRRGFAGVVVQDQYRKQLERVLSGARSAILVTAHVGNWDLAGAFLAHEGFPVAAVFERIPRGMSDVFNRFRGASGMELIGMDERGKMAAAIQSGKLFVLVGDRDLKGNGQELPWFSGWRTFPRGAAVFSLRHSVPIVIGYFVFDPEDKHRRYRAIVEPPLEFTSSGNMTRDVEGLTALVVRQLERVVRQYPDQWLVFQPDWRSVKGT